MGPSGILTEEVFKQVCFKFFPFNSSSSLYFNYVFSCIDTKAVGTINFEEFVKTLDLLKNGSLDEKICWIFRLYDVNRDGAVCISDIEQIASAIFYIISEKDDVLVRNQISDRVD